MEKQRIVYFDALNIAACLAVVFMHCNVLVHAYQPGINWLCSLVIEVVFWWAVPIFLMLSGANLMRYRDRYDTKTFFKKRMLRTFVPFIFWSIAIYFLRFGMLATSPTFGLTEFVSLFMNNGIETVYWFFFPLFALYLAYPVLSCLADRRRVLWYLAGTFFVLQSVIPPLATLFGVPWNTEIQQPVATGFVFYAVLGYLVSTQDISKKHRLIIYALGIAALIIRFVEMAYLSASLGAKTSYLSTSYASFVGVLPALAVFVFFKYLDFSKLKPKMTSFIGKVSSCSLGVYLIHCILIKDVIFGILHVPLTSIGLRVIAPFVVYALCVMIVLLIKKVPVLNRVVP